MPADGDVSYVRVSGRMLARPWGERHAPCASKSGYNRALQHPTTKRIATVARVFLSSTPPDVVEYRHAANAVLQRLGHQVVGLVAFQTEAQSSIQTRPADVSDADLVVVIMGWTFGTPPPGGGERSPLEFEYQRARSLGKPILVFLTRGGPRFQSEGGVDDLERVKAFREHLSAEHTVNSFASVGEFRERLAADIATWEQARGERPPTVTVDQLPLAWRLVVDFKGKPDLLRHLDAGAFTKALEHWEAQSGADSRKPWPERLERALSELESKQLPHAPNPLWLAWMQATQAPEPPAHDGGPRPAPVRNEPLVKKQSDDGPLPSTESSSKA